MSRLLTRGTLLGAGSAAVLGGAGIGRLAEGATAAVLPAGDLAYARLLVAAELLAADFYGQALAARQAGPTLTGYLKLARANELEHYASVAGTVSGAGQTPATAADIDFTYPAGTFTSVRSIVALARALEVTILGAYLGAVAGIQTSELAAGLARIAACEAQHVSCFSTVAGGKPFRLSFPEALTVDQASNALDAFTA